MHTSHRHTGTLTIACGHSSKINRGPVGSIEKTKIGSSWGDEKWALKGTTTAEEKKGEEGLHCTQIYMAHKTTLLEGRGREGKGRGGEGEGGGGEGRGGEGRGGEVR